MKEARTQNIKRRYHVLSLCSVLLFVYVIGSEVSSRASALVALSDEVNAKAIMAVRPESLQARRAVLTAEENRLRKEWNRTDGGDQPPTSESALYAYLQDVARAEGVEINSLEPIDRKPTSSAVQDIKFSIEGIARYNSLGKFLWRLEAGRVAIEIGSVSIKRREGSKNIDPLSISLTGRAAIVRAR